MNWRQLTQYSQQLIRFNSADFTPLKRFLTKSLQSTYAVGRDLFVNDQIQLRAMGLVYTTLLSIVPLLALSVSVLKAFGVHNKLEPVLQNFLEPLGEKGAELSSQIINFVENMNVAVLGTLGIALLFYTVLSLVQKVEAAFNYIWCVNHQRTLAQQISHYLTILMVGPVLLVSLVGVIASTMTTNWMQYLLSFDTVGFSAWFSAWVLPTLILTALITSVYMFVPNTKVRFIPAICGGIVAAILWKSGGSIFAAFVEGSSKYDAIYSGFAIAMMLIIWLFLSWLILLIGANISFYWQSPSSVLKIRDQRRPDGFEQQQLGMQIMVLIGRRFYHGHPGCSLEELSRQLVAPSSDLIPLIELFEQSNLLIKANTDQENYLPAQGLDAIKLKDIINTIEGRRPHHSKQSDVEHLFSKLEQQRDQILDDQTLRDFIIRTNPKSS